jgi:CubicO group peptidase (beta-lactamase class C family)
MDVTNLHRPRDKAMSYFLTLAVIAFACFFDSTKAQFNAETANFVATQEATELFTSGHQAVFQFDPLSNRSWNIYEKFGTTYHILFWQSSRLNTFFKKYPLSDGLHDKDHNFPMSRKSQFRIGSNAKTFTTIAILQLHEGRKLDIDHNVSRYLNATDLRALGVSGTTYCPVLYNVATNSPGTECQTLTFRNLLTMRSGIINSATCNYPPTAWQIRYCQESYFNIVWLGSTAEIVSSFINSPLDAVPGSTYFYSNDNQLFLSYLIEKFSGMKLEQYFSKYIFQPLGMNDTFLDSLSGELSSQKDFVSGYFDYSDLIITPDGTPFAYGRISPTESNQGVLSGSGGVVSTVWDMAKFYASFFLANNVSLISNAHREEMITPSGISGSQQSLGFCETWGLGTHIFNVAIVLLYMNNRF